RRAKVRRYAGDVSIPVTNVECSYGLRRARGRAPEPRGRGPRRRPKPPPGGGETPCSQRSRRRLTRSSRIRDDLARIPPAAVAGRRRPVAAAAGRGAGVAAGHRRAVEGRVELVLVHLEPAPERPAGAAPPRPPLLALDHARRLSQQVRTLALVTVQDGQRLER